MGSTVEDIGYAFIEKKMKFRSLAEENLDVSKILKVSGTNNFI